MHISRTTLLATAVGVFAATAFLYWPSVHGEFLSGDDTAALLQSFRMNGLTWAAVKWELTCTANYYQPLTRLSHVIDYQLFGKNPLGHHAMNIALHSLNAALVFGFLWTLLSATSVSAPERFALALGTAIVFAIHPFQAESVAWLAGRTQLLCTAFGIVCLWVYASGGKRWLVFALFFLAMMSKPMAVSLPFIMLAIDYYPLQRYQQRSWGRLLWEKTPLFAVAIVAGLAVVFTKSREGQVATLTATPLTGRLRLAFESLSFYPWKLIWPSHLSPRYPVDSSLSLAPVWVVASVIAVVMTTVAAVVGRRRWPMLVACWGSYLALVLPVSGLVTTTSEPVLATRYAYVAMLPVLLVVGTAAICVWRRSKRMAHLVLTGLFAVQLCASAAWTRHLIPDWRNDEAERRACLEEFPDSDALNREFATVALNEGDAERALQYAQRDVELTPKAFESHRALALVLARLGRTNEAVAHAREAYRLNPDASVGELGLGVILMDLGELPEAVYHFQQALWIQPATLVAHYNIGCCLYGMGRVREAASEFQAELKINPDFADAHNGLSSALFALGDIEGAIAQCRLALKLNPDLVEARYNLGLALARTGRLPEATKQWEDVVLSKPDHVDARLCLAEALESQGKVSDATRQYERALEFDPRCAEARGRLGAIYQGAGKLPEAVAQFQRALETDPNDADAHFNLALALEKLGRPAEAVREYEQVVRLRPDSGPAKDALARLQPSR
ncbi:MAG TPA: tetratricopeptide repeat protein [Verrucomicrobiae bacterium]|nr:tetratricopeptide repeat protein [Verrucomicrobiae bacterium]